MKDKKSLDIRDNARRSIKFLCGSVNPRADFLPYFYINYSYEKPEFIHQVQFDEVENYGRWLYGIAAAQLVSGSNAGDDVRKHLLNGLKERVGPYGFVYTYKKHLFTKKPQKRFTWMWGNRAIMLAWILNYELASSAMEKEEIAKLINGMVHGLEEFAVKKGRCLFFPTYTPAIDFKKKTHYVLPKPSGVAFWNQFYEKESTDTNLLPPPGDSLGGVIAPLVRWYEITGNEKALDIAEGVANAIVKYHMVVDNKTNPIGCMSNNHGTLYAISGVLMANKHRKNRSHLIWAKTMFDFYRRGSSFGWIPENENVKPDNPLERDSCEGCATVDLVSAGIELGLAGFYDCFDAVEKAARNYLVESQSKNVKPFSLKGVKINRHAHKRFASIPAEHRDNKNIWKRSEGSMAGWGAPNDQLDPQGRVAMCVQNCCSSHLPYGLLRVWENTVTKTGNEISVNLLLNNDSKWCCVKDFQPYEGKTEITMKEASLLLIRIPQETAEKDIKLSVDGRSRDVNIVKAGFFVSVGKVCKDSIITMKFAIDKRVTLEKLGRTVYKIDWKGDTIVNIEPPGKYIPLFKHRYK